MPLKAFIAISGAVLASAVTALPVLAPGSGYDRDRELRAGAADAPVSVKGDRLRILDPVCHNGSRSAVCADIYGPAEGPIPTVTVERQIGQSTTVLIRLPLSQIVPRPTGLIAEN